LKILIITTSYPTLHNGSEAAGSFVYDFVNTLGKNNSVAVVYPVEKNTLQCDSVDNYFPFFVPILPLSKLSPLNPFNWLAILKVLTIGQKTVTHAMKTFKPDHILALWTLPSGYWAKQAANTFNIPYSTWALGSDIWSLGKIPIIKYFIRDVLNNSKKCFADGHQLKLDTELLSNKPVYFLPSTRNLSIKKDKILKIKPPYDIAFLGRWHKNKGIDILLEVIEKMNDNSWGKISSIKIAGGGALNSLVYKKVNLLQNLGKPITLDGFLNSEEATELLLWADFLIIPSRIESIPVIYSDALQCMTPMVVTPVGDFPLLFNKNPPGVIADSINPIDILNSINTILSTPPSNYHDELIEAKEKFNIETIANSFLSHISEK